MGKYHVHRSDANANAIIAHIESLGAVVNRTGRPTDAIVGGWGMSVLVEIKTPRGALNASQRQFLKAWPGVAAVIRTKDQAELLVRLMAKRDPEGILSQLVDPEVK